MNKHTIQNGKVTVLAANIENRFLGLSLTEATGGLGMRRIATEIHDVDDMIKLRDVLTALIERRALA
jgi:hypothetical protein